MQAPEFAKDLIWVNSDPLLLNSLQGKIVLIDFWTYSCINCLRTLPHVKRWNELYKDSGLVIIGVHTPEFDFEKSFNNVKNAVTNLGITWPIVLDPDYVVWSNYENRYWPHQYLVDHEGAIVYDHAGEGNYKQTEFEIQKALGRIGINNLSELIEDEGPGGCVCYQATPEIYLGYERGHFGHWVAPDAEFEYTDLGHHHRDTVYLFGQWTAHEEFLEYTGASQTSDGALILPYHSFSVNLVIHPPGNGETKVIIEMDAGPVDPEIAGIDIEYENGLSYIRVTTPRLYQLINSNKFHDSELSLRPREPGVRFYAFTFGGCEQ